MHAYFSSCSTAGESIRGNDPDSSFQPRIGEPRREASCPKRPSVSVVIPVRWGGVAFAACVTALAASVEWPEELIIVADGETDGAWRPLREGAFPFGRVVVLVNERPRGPAHARNRGARAASGDVLLFLDADVVARPDVVARVRHAFAIDPYLDALVGSYDDAPAHPAPLSQYRNLLHHHTHQRSRERIMTFWGGCGAVRRRTFWEVGGFDECYRRPSVEDIELGYRLAQAGRVIRLDKALQVKHLKRWTLRSMLKTDLLARAVPWTKLLLRRRAFESNLNIDRSSRVSAASALLALAAAASAPLWPLPSLAAGAAALAAFAGANAPFFRFLRRRRGGAFALRAAPWHLLHATTAGLGCVLGIAAHLWDGPQPGASTPAPLPAG